MKIICINNEHDELEAMKATINKLNYCTVLGTFLFEKPAIDFLNENYCDLVILNVEDIDSAKESISKLKEGLNPYIMFAVITNDTTNAASAYKLGADGYLLKPVKEVELLLLLDKLVRIKNSKKPVNVFLSGGLTFNINGTQIFINKPKLEEFLVYLIYQNRNQVKMDDCILSIDKQNISDLKERYLFRLLCFELKQLCIDNNIGDIFTYTEDTCIFNCNHISCDLYDLIEEEIDEFDYKYLYSYKWVEKDSIKPEKEELEEDDEENEENASEFTLNENEQSKQIEENNVEEEN